MNFKASNGQRGQLLFNISGTNNKFELVAINGNAIIE
jgi:hypothetical protein